MDKIRESSFKFYNDDYNNHDKSYYDINVIVKDITYDNDPTHSYYDISYQYKYNEDKDENSNKRNILKNHPFKKDMESACGTIIYKNEMTDKMIEYLLMDDDNLSRISGKSTPQFYRHRIMISIASLWD